MNRRPLKKKTDAEQAEPSLPFFSFQLHHARWPDTALSRHRSVSSTGVPTVSNILDMGSPTAACRRENSLYYLLPQGPSPLSEPLVSHASSATRAQQHHVSQPSDADWTSFPFNMVGTASHRTLLLVSGSQNERSACTKTSIVLFTALFMAAQEIRGDIIQ